MYLFPLKLPVPATARRLEAFELTTTQGGCEFSPFRVPVAADFFPRVTKYLCAGACALTREGASKWPRFGLFGSSIRCDSTGI